MKNAAKCDMSCELQNSVNHRIFERKLRSWDSPKTTLPGVSVPLLRHLRFSHTWQCVVEQWVGLRVRVSFCESLEIECSSYHIYIIFMMILMQCGVSKNLRILPLSWTLTVCKSYSMGGRMLSWILASSDVDDAIICLFMGWMCAFSPSGTAGFCIHRQHVTSIPNIETSDCEANKDESIVVEWKSSRLLR